MPAAAPLRKKGLDKAPAVPRTIQTKLDVGASGDHFEREADSVAQSVMRGGSGPVAIPPTITPLGAQRKIAAAEKPREEDKKIQRKAAGPMPVDDDKKVQRKANAPGPIDDRKVQRKAAAPAPVDEDKGANKHAQRDAMAAGGAGTAPSSVESSIASMQAGSAGGLDHGTRGFMEGRFGRDFGGVRVHNGAQAAEAAQSLNARAFTVGRDVFFNAGQYAPHSPSGRELIAHELTHTVQQANSTSSVGRKIQRVTDPPPTQTPTQTPAKPGGKKKTKTVSAPGEAAKAGPFSLDSKTLKDASIRKEDGKAGIITLPKLELPEIGGVLKGTDTARAKADGVRSLPVKGAPFKLDPVGPRPNTQAYKIWTDYLAKNHKDAIETSLKNFINDSTGKADSVYYLTLASANKGDRENVFTGTIAELAASDAMLRPQWSKAGKALTGRSDRFAADHILEHQLGGMDSAENMWLIQFGYNSSVGSSINGRIDSDLEKLRGEIPLEPAPPNGLALGSATAMRYNWTIQFLTVAGGSGFANSAKVDIWTREDVVTGEHLKKLKLMNAQELADIGLTKEKAGQPTTISIFTSKSGGKMAKLEIDATGKVKAGTQKWLFQNVFILGGDYIGGKPENAKDGYLIDLEIKVNETKEKKIVSSKTGKVKVKAMPAFGNAGYITRESLRAAFKNEDFEFTGMSPLKLTDVWIAPEGAFAASGTITSTKALLPKLQIPIQMIGDEILMDFPIPAANIKLGPLSIFDSSLSIGFSSEKLFMRGGAYFAITGIGQGSAFAEVSTDGPVLKGQFDLDTKFLDPAHLEVSYDFDKSTLKGSGTFGVQEGTLPGVKSGEVTINVSDKKFDVSGTVLLAAPFTDTTLKVDYNEKAGLSIAADNIDLPFSKLPGVKDAKMSVRVGRRPGGKWNVSGIGKANLAVPNATGQLAVTYDDGLVVLHGQGKINRPPVTGEIDFTATNAPLDGKGNPIKSKAGSTITAWGKGNVAATFGSIKATAGVEYKPDGRLMIDGRIALAKSYQLFARRDFNKTLFTYTSPEFTIWGLGYGGYGIGIFASADVSVGFESHVGPGELRNAEIDATMDVARPDEAKLHGSAEFHVPAYAGLVAELGGNLIARVTVAYAKGHVALVGRLGLAAEAGAKVDVNWSKATGMALQANIYANVAPKLSLSAKASLTVGAGIGKWKTEETLGPWEKKLGELGPAMKLEVTLPVRWSEAKGLDLNADQITVTKPNLDANSLMKGSFEGLAGPPS